MANVQAGVVVSMFGVATRQASERRLVSECIPGPTTRTSEAHVRGVTEPNRHPYQRCQQQNALREESRTPLLPSWQTVGIGVSVYFAKIYTLRN